MSKARSQMPQKSGRAEAAHGEAVGESASDEARDPLAEHRDTGLAKTKAHSRLLVAVLRLQMLEPSDAPHNGCTSTDHMALFSMQVLDEDLSFEYYKYHHG